MNVVIHRFRDYEFSPMHNRVVLGDDGPRVTLSRISSSSAAPQVPWIVEASSAARSGIPQAAVLAASCLLIALHLVRRCSKHGSSQHAVKPRASGLRWRYEVLSQMARAAALAFLAVAFFQGRAHVLNLVLLAYAFTLGLSRLATDVLWRQAALHHVNLVTLAELVILVTAQLLPCVEIDFECPKDASVVGATAALSFGLAVAMCTPRQWIQPQLAYAIPGFRVPDEPALEEETSWINYYCTYQWLTPTIWKGTWGKLDMSGIPKLAWYDEPLYLLRQVRRARAASKSTLWTTLRFQRRELTLMSIWIGLAYVFENVAPFGMFQLLAYLDDPSSAICRPWVWLLLTFFGPMSRSILFQGYVFTSTRLIVRIKSAMTQELYQRALESMELEDDPFAAKFDDEKEDKEKENSTKATSAGRLANLMAADVDAIFKARDVITILVGVPAGTIVSFVGLYRMLGWVSIVGVAILVLATPISVLLGKWMFRTQKKVRKAQDSRISLVTEYLASIKAIKYFAWEKPITEKIIESRAFEQKALWGVSVLQVFINQITQIFPYLSLLVMFGLHVMVDQQPLTASTAFTTVYLVKNIRRNIMMASYFARSFAGAMVAFGRLDKYFSSTVPLVQYPEGPLRIEKGNFRRNRKATFRLEDISLDFVQDGLNVVTGQSGSGKSTLMLAILGETYLESGSISVPADIAYASQTSWLQNETIKDNILFGSPMEKVRYDRVLTACCLPEDLRELPDGDRTSVGENGTSLSGGQRARVALARALYSKAPLLLLDDIFAALDAKTSAGVWKHCFCGELLKGRTVVLVTQVPWIAAQADLSILLEKGQVKSAEPNIGVVRRPIKIAEVLGGDADDSSETDVETPPEPDLQATSDALNDPDKIAQDVPVKDVVDQEAKASGKVTRWTMIGYMGYFGHPLFAVACILGLFLANIFYFGANFWLFIWVEAYEKSRPVDAAYYLSIFAAFIFLEIIAFGLIVITFEWGGWRAARRLHNDFIRSIISVPLSWFKTIPVGRITNRFSGDMASIDGNLSGMVRQIMDIFMMLFFRLGAVSSIMPIFMIPGLFTCFIGVLIGEMYTRTAVVIKRLTSSSQSPVFSQFADTLSGLAVIRARKGKAQGFRFDLADKLRVWSATAEANYNCNRWVGVRIDFVTSLVSLFAGIIAISKAGIVGAGLVGFSLTNANDLSNTVLYMVRAMNDLEVEMQSFHRVKEYVKLEPEDKDDKPYPDEGEAEYVDDETHVIPKDWPRSGEVEFRNVTIRYDPDGPDILSSINLKFNAGERVAVVGRTGSGKSTLVLSLLRFTDIVSGEILFDGVDITKLPRTRLRKSLTIIPQEAVLFSGSVESNLDPTGRVPREQLEAALDNCKGVASFSGNATEEDENEADTAIRGHAQAITLSTEVDARGENFSHGQRQVLSLCRALIRKSKLMLLDEATASMDYETDRGIQRILRDDLEADDDNRTLVTIAHRLRTIIDYDKVVVMSAGRVLEYGSPRELFDAKGQFYDMVYHSGEMEELEELLEE
ncbi:ABC transporter, transmembrane domain, type 1 [Metarhizium album ARSEF 1941]|uniref:ABC transporter, transmembrane domain, type 1 n=1 Tax=Metarhizium album (strain ARSEF 1941) TaxID=1081103 RepID=A0A0B2X6Z4_METAS|nr:ABC transporter, transmembrane domain, type 1 [Metarhizium album ARSEF 1941]KHO01548.1 ABC transporter, transmembrane domain, type 1 [Metarhizium album ARSEF 1941]